MTTVIVFLLILFLLLLVCFYFIAILYAKVSKFHDLEHKQRKLMSEMEDTMGAYLSELKDENNRLMRLLEKRIEKGAPTELVPERKVSKEEPAIFNTSIPKKPMNLALKSYKTSTITDKQPERSNEQIIKLTDRERAVQLQAEGYSIEEIAKRLEKGKTEVELLLKFS